MNYERNTKKHITLPVPGTDMSIPATVICGSVPGKTITISAGVHSRAYAESGGIILYQTISLGVEKGKPMITYGELTEEG